MEDSEQRKISQILSIENLAKNLFLSGIGIWHLSLRADELESSIMTLSESFLLLLGDGTIGSSMGLKDYIGLFVHPDEVNLFLRGLDDLYQGRDDYCELEQRLWSHARHEFRWMNFNAGVIDRSED